MLSILLPSSSFFVIATIFYPQANPPNEAGDLIQIFVPVLSYLNFFNRTN